MSEQQPSLTEIGTALAQLADRVARAQDDTLDPYVSHALRSMVNALETHIPGIEPPVDHEAARGLLRAAEAAIHRGDARESLTRSLRGLGFSPHDPLLWYAAGSACFELGQVEDALRVLCHVLWIHPGHSVARSDLDALTAFFDGEEGDRAA